MAPALQAQQLADVLRRQLPQAVAGLLAREAPEGLPLGVLDGAALGPDLGRERLGSSPCEPPEGPCLRRTRRLRRMGVCKRIVGKRLLRPAWHAEAYSWLRHVRTHSAPNIRYFGASGMPLATESHENGATLVNTESARAPGDTPALRKCACMKRTLLLTDATMRDGVTPRLSRPLAPCGGLGFVLRQSCAANYVIRKSPEWTPGA